MRTTINTSLWAKISLYNLLAVALLGLLMRYKIGFEFPIFNQKNLQHAHSHFAFAGWISQTIMVGMIALLNKADTTGNHKHYRFILWTNLLTAWGMLFSFAAQGYGPFSIFFSTSSILLSFYFSIRYFEDLSQCEHIKQKHWFVAALIFNILSALGTFALVYMMVTKNIPQHPYLASVYWYLHFQYNGWFFFACMGLFVQYVFERIGQTLPLSVFWLFAASCIPAYGLSILWLKLPVLIYSLVVLASLAQFAGWIILLKKWALPTTGLFSAWPVFQRRLFIYIGMALSIKLCLQLGSVIPEVSKLAFGFRPIVIAYLHLVLLAITSLFLITYLYMQGWISANGVSKAGIVLFALGIFLNEAALAVQGIASFSYTLIPNINLILFIIAIALVMSILLMIIGQKKSVTSGLLL